MKQTTKTQDEETTVKHCCYWCKLEYNERREGTLMKGWWGPRYDEHPFRGYLCDMHAENLTEKRYL